MKGTVTKRGKTWSIVFYQGKTDQGKWKQTWVSGFPSKKEAERELRRRIDDIEASGCSSLSTKTVSVFLQAWLNSCEQRLAPNTIRGYRTNVEKHINPYLGSIPIAKVTAIDIQRLYSKLLEQGLSPTSVRYVHNNLHKAFAYGVKTMVLPRNPAEQVDPPRINHFEAATLKPEEVVKLLTACRGTEIYLPVLLAVSLGLRRGEILGLTFDDVDLDNGVLFVRHSAQCNNLESFRLADTKTRSSRRTLLLPALVVSEIRQCKTTVMERRTKISPSYNSLDLVCHRDLGTPFTANTLQHQFKNALYKAGLRDIRFHDLRHSYTTLLARSAVNPRITAEILGHSGVGITLERYTHVQNDMQRPAVEAIDALLNTIK